MSKPAWRGAFDRVERAVGAPLEDVVASPRYVNLVVLWLKGPVMVNRVLRRALDRPLGNVLHLLNMPTREDVARLGRQLAVLTSEVRALSLPADQISSYVVELQQREGEPPPAAVPSAVGDADQAGPAATSPAPGTKQRHTSRVTVGGDNGT